MSDLKKIAQFDLCRKLANKNAQGTVFIAEKRQDKFLPYLNKTNLNLHITYQHLS